MGGGGGKQGQAYSHGFIEHLLYLFQAIFWVRRESSKPNGQSLFPPGQKRESGIGIQAGTLERALGLGSQCWLLHSFVF